MISAAAELRNVVFKEMEFVSSSSLMCPLDGTIDIKDDKYDGVLVVTDSLEILTESLEVLRGTIEQYQKINSSSEKAPAVLYCADLPSKRLIYSPTGPVTRDYDDVRNYQEAAEKGMKCAIDAGCKAPLLVRPTNFKYPLAGRVAILAAMHATYTPLEVREACPEKAQKLDKLGIFLDDPDSAGDTIRYNRLLITAMETARVVYRDIGGSDPERMAAPRVAEYVENLLKDTCVKVNVISDLATIEKEYPLFEAVNRGAKHVERHQGRVVFLEFEGQAPIDTTLLLVGKGITYDTGGADLKVNGNMRGMHRDKCGAAFVAGFFQMLSIWKPKGLKVIGVLTLARNSVGSECYVSDEIITSRAGVRVRIGNTDAEGRMVMGDLLCQMKEKAASETNPMLFTIATLTGHVIRAYGENYTAIVCNGPAKKAGIGEKIQRNGEVSGDPFEISNLRKEDYAAFRGKSEYEDIIQSSGKPSTQSSRGHQGPAAFLAMASGLDKHGNDSSKPLPYSHLDIAGSSGPFPGIPTGAPIPAFSLAFCVNRESAAIPTVESLH